MQETEADTYELTQTRTREYAKINNLNNKKNMMRESSNEMS